MKKFLIGLIGFLLLLTTIAVASAEVTITSQIVEAEDYNQNSDVTLQDVTVRVYECTDNTCSTLVNENDYKTYTTNAEGEVTLTFPGSSGLEYFGVYIFAEGYLAYGYVYPIDGDDWSETYKEQPSLIHAIQKVDICRSTIDSFEVTNSVEAYQPIFVDVLTNLDAQTYSAFTVLSDMYLVGFEDTFYDFYAADVDVVLNIENSDGTVYSETQYFTILADESQPIHFEWTPTEAGDYTARVSTYVTDDQCESTEEQYSEKDFTVLPEGSTNFCYTLLQDLTLNDPTGHYYVDQEYTVSYEKLSNSVDSEAVYSAVPTDIDFVIYKIVDVEGELEYVPVAQESYEAPANSDPTQYERYNYLWTPQYGGDYLIQVDGIATNCLYSDNQDDTIGVKFYVEGDFEEEFPVAEANGPYTGYFDHEIQFTSTGSYDPDGGSLTYLWDFGDGETSTSAYPAHTYTDKEGDGYEEYTVTLTVTDDEGNSASDTAFVTITTALVCEQPVAHPNGPYSGLVNEIITFDGTGSSDPDGGAIVLYNWDFGDQNSFQTTELTINHIYTAPGIYTVTLTVLDEAGVCSEDGVWSDPVTTTVTITEETSGDEEDPLAIITVDDVQADAVSALVDQSLAFSGELSTDQDENGASIVSYAWDFGDNTASSEVTADHAYPAPGTYIVTLTVTDDEGAQSMDSVTIVVSDVGPENLAPTANANGPYNGEVNEQITFDGSGSSDPEGQVLTYSWDFGDTTTGTGVNPVHSYAAAGVYTVTLTVTDPLGLSATDSTTATVTAAPIGEPLNVTITADPTHGVAPLTVTFGATVTGGTEPYTYSWLVNGQTITDPAFMYTFTQIGTYTVLLTVTDDKGDTAQDSETIVVEADVPLNATLIATPAAGEPALFVRFTATVNSGNAPFTYAWDFDGNGNIDEVNSDNHPLYIYRKEGTYHPSVIITDATGDVIKLETVVRVKQKVENNGRDQLFVNTIRVDGDNDYVNAGETAYVRLSATNIDTEDKESLQVKVVIPELGIYGVSQEYDLDSGSRGSAVIAVPIPEWVEPGVYTMRIVISDDTVKRIKHRDIIVR